MKKALVLEKEDVRKLLAEKYKVDSKNVITNAYSYTVVLDDIEDTDKPDDSIEGGG